MESGVNLLKFDTNKSYATYVCVQVLLGQQALRPLGQRGKASSCMWRLWSLDSATT